MQNVSNDQLIQAVFTATTENKSRAFDILQGKADPSSDLRPPSSDDGPLLMSMGESAKFLNVSRGTLWRMVRDGRLTKVEIYHNAFRLRRSDILALVNDRPSRGADIPVCVSPGSKPHAPCSTPKAVPHG